MWLQKALSQASALQVRLQKNYQKGGVTYLENQSILNREFIQTILGIARKNLEQDGHLYGVLFLQLATGQRLVHMLELVPKTPEERAALLFRLGQSLRAEGKLLAEAVMVLEAWVVEAQKAPAALSVPPHEHPLRREAIIAVGRDAQKTLTSFVVLPFHRDQAGQPVWETITLATYRSTPDKRGGFVGLLDDFFEGYHLG